MLRATFILGSLGTIISPLWAKRQQTPAEWWVESTQEQKDFAERVYKIGIKYGNRGHTLTGIGWMESGLGAATDHSENSFGYFGLSAVALLDIGAGPEVFDSLQAGILGLERESFLALDYFALCEKRLRSKGFSKGYSWRAAYQKYNAGSRWKRFKRRGEVFNDRVRFLKRKFK